MISKESFARIGKIMTVRKKDDRPRILASRLPDFLTYPERKPDESAKYCKRCGTRQYRRHSTYGPMNIRYCADLPRKNPRISSHGIWKCLLLSWLVSPPNPPDDDKWYRHVVRAECPNCAEQHIDKDFRRQFGRLGRAMNWLKSRLSSSYELIARI